MLLMIAYTKINTASENKGNLIETAVETKAAGGVQSLLLTDRLAAGNHDGSETGENQTSEEPTADQGDEAILGPAEKMDLEKARKKSYGLVAELDYVSADRISMHGSFGYLVFSLNGSLATLERAVTFEELGGIKMGGAAYTDILAGEGCALVVPGIHNEEIARRRKFLYIEETNEITGGIVAPAWMMEKTAVNDYSDALVEEAKAGELKQLLNSRGGGKLLYGPVAVSGAEGSIYGFLSEDGEKLEDLWYGLWDTEQRSIEKVKLFP